MRSYRINTDRIVNQLVPHYLGWTKTDIISSSHFTTVKLFEYKMERMG